MKIIRDAFSYDFLGHPAYLWIEALILWVVIFICLRAVTSWIRRKVERYPRFRVSGFRFSKLFLLTASLYLASLPIGLKAEAAQILGRIFILGFLFQCAIWGDILLRVWLDKVFMLKADDLAAQNTIGLLSTLAKAAMYSLLFLLALNNLGVDITALVAGLGVGGIAVALAAQNILGDLFASFTIVLDRPFLVGDAIQVDDIVGIVEHVGLKTTRVRALSGEQLVYPNTHLLQNRIRNYKRMKERRIVATFGVTYETPADKLEKIPDLLKEIVQAQTKTRFDRAHFKSYGAFSLDFELVYWIEDPDYTVFMNIQQAINLAIFRRFGQEKISFAYPTQTLYMHRQAADAST